MGILKRLFGGDERPRQSSTISVDPVGPTPELRLSRRDAPRTRPNRYGPGEVHVTGYHFVHADGGGLAGADDCRLWRMDHDALDLYPSGVSHLDSSGLQSDGLLSSRRLTLVRDADNEYDGYAVHLALEDGRHAGWVPRGTAPTGAERLDPGEQLACAVLDQTHNDNGDRVAFLGLLRFPECFESHSRPSWSRSS